MYVYQSDGFKTWPLGNSALLVSLFHFVYHYWVIFVFGCCQRCPELYLHFHRDRINADLSVALNASEVGFTLTNLDVRLSPC